MQPWDGNLFSSMVIRESNWMVGLGGGKMLDLGKCFLVDC
jgi:glycerol dehydrogenase-like iron-containing ADH family enzyme